MGDVSWQRNDTSSFFIVPSLRLIAASFVCWKVGRGERKPWIMTVSARGPRRNRVWAEMRARLGRDAGASGARHVRTRGRVRQGSVGHGSLVMVKK